MNATVTTLPEGYRIEAAFDGYFYPQVQDGSDYEYMWGEDGEDVCFATEGEAIAYLQGRVQS